MEFIDRLVRSNRGSVATSERGTTKANKGPVSARAEVLPLIRTHTQQWTCKASEVSQ